MGITNDKWNEIDGNAISDLHLALVDGVLSSVRKLYTLRMAESTMVTDRINTLKTLFLQLTTLGHNIDENKRSELLLQNLPDSYDQLIINLTNNNPVDSLVFDDVVASVLNEESMRKNKENRQASSQQADALSVTRGRSTERGLSGSQNHGRSKFRSKKNVKCYNCGKKGHVKKECWSNQKRKEGKELELANAQGCVASTSDDGKILYSEAIIVSEGRKRLYDIWLIGSGATWHMISRREWFHTYEPISGGFVYMGNDHALVIAGIDTIKTKIFDGTICTIGEVRHVNGLKKNLLSLGQMDSHGYKTHVENEIMKIVKGTLVLMKAEKIGANLFMLKGEILLEADAYGEFLAFYKQEGIQRQFTVAYIPQQNGVTERMNRTLTEQIRAMLRTAGLPNSFWAEAAKTACYLVNRSPSTFIGLKTAMEMWTGKPADYSYLHTFRCLVYVMYNAQERTKLDPKSRRCIFLGYADGIKGYRLWDSTAHWIVISRDVIFIEDQLQKRDEDDSSVKEKSETLLVYVKNNPEDSDSSEATLEHEEQESVESEAPEVRRSTREKRPQRGTRTMQEEIEALHKNKTWELIPLPHGRKTIGNKCVYKIKRYGNDQVERLSSDHCEYYKRFKDNDFIILLLYVDDMLVTGPNKDRVQELKAQLAREFEMKDLVPANKILGMQIHRDRNNRKIWLSQENYLKKILQRFNMQDCKSISILFPVYFKLSSSMCPSNEAERNEMSRVPYASTVGSLMFAMLCTRPDITQAVRAVSRYMANPGGEHWIVVKKILRYIRGTSDVALCYEGSEFTVRGYVDLDFAGDLDKRKSTTGYVFTLARRAVSWVSKLQTLVALSITEAEYMAATQACKEAVWIQRLLKELGHKQEKISVFCDSQSALYIARNPAFHSRTKHIGVQYHFVRKVVEDGSVDLQKIHTKENLADVLTKPINTDMFIWSRSSYGLAET
ncbi:hypothetical protein KPL70_021889 [Citrus sinensis]|nr:hypothetical protein KPL70_021889 [Citrus sinensis]